MKTEFNLSEKKYNAVEFMRKLSYNPIVRYKNQTDVYQWIQEIVDLAIKQKNEDIKEFIKRLEEKASDVNKHLGLHNVDECECCEKNWKCVYEILEIIDELAGDKLVEKGK